MLLSEIAVNKDDLERVAWEQVVNACEEKTCQKYSDAFLAKARESEAAGDSQAQGAWVVLSAITSLMLKPESKDEPFAPLMVFNTFRSAIPADFSEAQLDVLAEWVPMVSDPELRARVADLIWFRKRKNFRLAELAIDAYLQSASVLEHPEQWVECVRRIQRAMRLAVSLGRNSQRFPQVVQHIESVLDKYNGEDPLLLSSSLMELLLEFRQGDALKYAALAQKAAVRAEQGGNWHVARIYWEISAKWFLRAQNPEAARTSKIRLAETYVQEAESVLKSADSHNISIAAHHVQRAIEALRRVSGTQERRAELHKVLLDYQARSVEELGRVSTTVDLAEAVRDAIAQVTGKTLYDALFALAFIAHPWKVSDLRAYVEQSAKAHPLQHLFSASLLSNSGKVQARRPSLLFGSKEEVEAAVRAEMFQHASLHRDLQVRGVIEPARHQISLEHNVQVGDLFRVVTNNPFVPERREPIYAQGLYAGLIGDPLVAVHLLIPQLENSFRYLLNQRGIPTSSLDDNGIQQEYDLNQVLYIPELAQILDEDTLFDLKGLLVEVFGSNLRNRIAHGLMNYDEAISTQSIYLWWLTLRLCCFPIVRALKESQNATQKTEQNN